MSFLQKLWTAIKKVAGALEPSIFCFIVLLTAYLILVELSQGRDAVLALADSTLFPAQIILCIVVILWAAQTWCWARGVYILRLPDNLMNTRGYPGWVKNEMPRILGVMVFLLVAYACLGMTRYAENSILTWMAVVFLILALLFYFTVRLLDSKLDKLKPFEATTSNSPETTAPRSIMGIPRGTRTALIILTIIALIPLLFFLINPQASGFVGASSVIILCISIWVPLGSWILLLSHKWKLPVFAMVIIVAMIFSLWNDNHKVRVLEGHPQRMTFEARLNTFLKKYPSADDETKKEEPLYIIAAEGGGIRAAYWTALLLGGIQDKDPEFVKHIFAISGASGGSLGISVFVALLKEKQPGCETGETGAGPYFNCAAEVLKGDFLSPTAAMMLTGDLLQKIIPFPVPHFSRGQALEQAWEIAWKKAAASDRFAEPMNALWENDDACDIPSLFLNGTLVETGQRIIASNICIDEHTFIDTLDVYDYIKENQDMRLSTAVNCSARFPVISPPGTLSGGIHVVDGGYFDDYGAATALEIYYAVEKKLQDKQKNPKKVKPVVILLSNDQIKLTPRIKSQIKPLRFLVELRAPIKTLMNLIGAFSIYCRDTLRDYVEVSGGTYLCFEPFKEKLEFPLGWTLSKSVRKEMAKQAFAEVERRWPPGNKQ